MAKLPRILVVDDEMSIRGILNEVFRALHYDVVEAPSVEVALVKMNLISFDVVISDIRMAGQSGIDLLKKVKKMSPDTEVIIMTSHASLESSLEAIRLGAYDYLLKPFEELEYVEIVVARALSHQKLKKENKALLMRTTQRNQEMEKGAGRAAQDLIEIASFYKIASSLLKSKNRDALISRLEEGLALFLKGKSGLIWVYQRETKYLLAEKKLDCGILSIPPLPLVGAPQTSDAALCLWMRKGDYKAQLNQVLRSLTPQNVVHQPLIYQERVYGVLSVVNRPAKSWVIHEKNTFIHLCLIASMMFHLFEVQSSSAQTQVQKDVPAAPSKQGEMSIQDKQTGLVAYGCFLDLLYFEIQRARRYRHPFTLLLLRFDCSLEEERNTAVHAFLQEWAKRVLSKIRTTDIATRDKNNIFVLLPETSQRESRKVIRALKRQMSSLRLPNQTEAHYAEGDLEKATYPKDGDSVGGLMSVLKTRISEDESEDDS